MATEIRSLYPASESIIDPYALVSWQVWTDGATPVVEASIRYFSGPLAGQSELVFKGGKFRGPFEAQSGSAVWAGGGVFSVIRDTPIPGSFVMTITADDQTTVATYHLPIPTIAQEKDHHGQAAAKLLEQFKGKPGIDALLSCYTRQVQDLENALFRLLIDRIVNFKQGDSLDVLGRIVGAPPRDGMNDTEYRSVIKLAISVLLSCGTFEDLITIARLLVGRGNFKITSFAGAVLVEVLPSLSAIPSMIVEYLQRAAMAGVNVQMVYLPAYGEETRFAFANYASPPFSPQADRLRGFSSVTSPTTGGVFSAVIEAP